MGGGVGKFTYTEAATTAASITGVAPATGPKAGGTQIVISGSGFDTTKSATTTVEICSVACTIVGTFTATEITCTTGAYTGTVGTACDVVVKWESSGTAVEGGVGKFTYTEEGGGRIKKEARNKCDRRDSSIKADNNVDTKKENDGWFLRWIL